MAHKLCMIPGPVEFDEDVLGAMSTLATSHVAPDFIEKFGSALELLRKVFFAPTGQPFVVAGSGTLTWDMTASNLVEPGEDVLVINTGVFGDWFGECLEVYGANVTHVRAAFGDRPTLDQIRSALSEKKYKLVTITHVDTSTSVLNDAKAIAEVVKQVSPETLIALDGVCSVGAEEIRQEEWGIDVVMTASQKAIGVPPGLGIMVVSQRALSVAANRKAKPTSYFASWKKWLPIMQKYENRQPSYFATPPVQLIIALQVSLQQLVDEGMDRRFQMHKEAASKVKDRLEALGLKLVSVNREVAANTLTAVYYPEGVQGPALLKKIGEAGIVVAGGLHPQHATKYFRVGHMNVSVVDLKRGHLDKTLAAVENAVKYAVVYKVSQRTYQFAGQPVAADWVSKACGGWVKDTVGERKAHTVVQGACAYFHLLITDMVLRESSGPNVFAIFYLSMLVALSGLIVGLGELAFLPLDALKVKTQTSTFPASKIPLSSSAPMTANPWRMLLSPYHLRYLYRGASWTGARNMLGLFSLFGASAAVKDRIFNLDPTTTSSTPTPTFTQTFIASCAGAAASIAVASPLDVVKVRVQAAPIGQPVSGWMIVKEMLKKEGVRAFAKGLTPKLISTGPKMAMSYTVAQMLFAYFETLEKGVSGGG
ncbi:hypothetical protein HK104_010126, partial [Borealophlyctis nickersoniae]